MSSLKELAVTSAIWNVSGGIVQTIIRLLASMVLARALDPFDFGIMGMGMIILSFLSMMGNMGIGAGIIAKRHPEQDDLSTAFWLMLIFRIVLFGVGFLSAPLFANFFNEPCLVNAFRAMSFVFLFSAISSVSGPLLAKELKFKERNIIQVLGVLLESSIAVFLAINTKLHYWSLIIAMLISCIFLQISLFWAAKWWPTFKISLTSLQYYKKYITNGLGSSLLVYFLGNIDYLIVGRLLGGVSLGFYEFSYRIPHLIRMRFAQPLSNVLFPVLVKSDDSERSLYGLYTVIKIISLVAFLVLTFLAIFSREVVLFLWGEKWLKIVPLLSIASISALIECIMASRGSVFLACDRPDMNFKSNLIHVFLTVIFVFFLTKQYGLIGAAVGMLLGLIGPFFFFIISIRMMHGKFSHLLSFFVITLSIVLIVSMFLKILVFPYLEAFNFYFAVIFTGILYLCLSGLLLSVVFSSFLKEIISLLRMGF